ncbi:Putative peptidoglycan binding domain-containing protein [Methylocapsa palsarum]|uniref:Putative peptidoglycan binding domain-containing protein n=2 Tax=Methylocapsa palsarum TaxID=1612308 RepID=A0A1I3XSF0_9HYPH|nr:Putative peptidoglycan binding domain-containing protein [Methylocapsa palsarum]
MLDKPFSRQRRPANQRRKPRRRYGLLICAVLGTAVVAGIIVNALTLQTSRHPAPLFAKAASLAPAREPAIAETAPAPVARIAPGASTPALTSEEKTTFDHQGADKVVNLHPRQAPAANAPAEEETGDPISTFLKAPPAKTGSAKPSGAKTSPAQTSPGKAAAATSPSASSAAPSKTILAAQRALVKLGFVLKPDGVAGLTTRQAIERYERDRGRPVHGALTPALSRQLSAESGVPIR